MPSFPRARILVALSVVFVCFFGAASAPAATAAPDLIKDAARDTTSGGTAAAAIEPAALRPVRAAAGETAIAGPYLRSVLPDGAYAYVRVPNIWRLLGAPTGGVLDEAFGSQPHVEAVASIRAGVAENLIPELPADAQAAARLLLAHVRSPIEAVALPNPSASPAPPVLVSMQVDFPDHEALADFLGAVAATNPDLTLVTPPTADAAGVLAGDDRTAQIRLDKAQSRLFLLLGSALAPSALDTTLASLQANPSHPMLAVESGIDASGQGFFAWMEPVKARTAAAAAGKGQELLVLDAFGFAAAKSVALGVGTSGGIQRAKFAIEMPAVGFRTFLPVVRTPVEVEAAGEPTLVTVLGLPSPGDLATVESTVGAFAPPEAMQAYLQGKQSFADKLGFRVEDVLAVLGQDLALVADEAGQYLAVRLKDPAKLESLIANAVERLGLGYSRREIAGNSYHHMIIPSFDAGEPAARTDSDAPGTSPLEQRHAAMPSHLYWTRDGDYLLFARIPQVLIDRGYIAARTHVGRWLAEQQRMDPQGALVLVSVRNERLPALMYRWNLAVLAYLGDLAGRPVDLFELPSVRELGIPDAGAYGIKITSSETELAFELAFEANPAEVLFAGQGYASVAAIGVLAAIAVPAYQEYQARTQVALALDAAAELRDLVALSVERDGRFPDQREIAALDPARLSGPSYRLSVSPDDGRVVLELDIDALDEGARIDLVPERQDGGLAWRCESDIDPRYLPEECRP